MQDVCMYNYVRLRHYLARSFIITSEVCLMHNSKEKPWPNANQTPYTAYIMAETSATTGHADPMANTDDAPEAFGSAAVVPFASVPLM